MQSLQLKVLMFWLSGKQTNSTIQLWLQWQGLPDTVQASSVPSERAFSTGVDLVTPDRCSLTGETIEKAQFLKFHL
jgi:hypothetical protein